MLLMEDIILAVVPVGEGGVVRARLLNRARRLHDLIDFPLRLLALLPPKLAFVRRRQIHSVRVDNLALLLQVERLLVRLHLRLRQLPVVVLPIV